MKQLPPKVYFRPFRRVSSKAFSLVEVALAIGVVSFAMLSMLCLVPVGLASVHESAQQVACSHILQKLGSDLTMIPKDKVVSYIGEHRYFDQEGNMLPAGSADARFVVALNPETLRYPGSDNLTNLNDHTRIVVTIARALGNGNSEADAVIFRTSISLADSK